VKNLGFILVSALTIPILLLLGVYLLWPQQAAPQPALIISVDEALVPFETELNRQETATQDELNALLATLEKKQVAFEAQSEARQAEIDAAQRQLDGMQTQVAELEEQVARLEISRTVRLAEYQLEMEQTDQAYQAQLAELEQQVQETEAQLARTNEQLDQSGDRDDR
jgi:chromosome segregation ATPase